MNGDVFQLNPYKYFIFPTEKKTTAAKSASFALRNYEVELILDQIEIGLRDGDEIVADDEKERILAVLDELRQKKLPPEVMAFRTKNLFKDAQLKGNQRLRPEMEWDFYFGQKFVANYGLFIDFQHIVDNEFSE